LLEAAKKKGMRTAIVSSDVTFASSAAFVSHVADRGDVTDIAEQMLDWKRVGQKDIYNRDITFGVDLILGGGRKVFTGNNARVLSTAIDMGYTYTTNMTEFLNPKDEQGHDKEVKLPLLGLFDDEHIDYEVDRNKDETPNLAELTRRGLEIMESASNGFIMVVSGHGIQSACLQGDPGALYGELTSWDAAVGEAVNFIKEKSIETLLLVLSDLDTAGLTLSRPGLTNWNPRAVLDQRGSMESVVQKIAEKHYNETELEQLVEQRLGIALVNQERDLVEANQDNATSLYPILSNMVSKRAGITWSTASNTGQDVNMFVYGRGHEEFVGNIDNAKISRMLDELMTMKVEEITTHLNGKDSTEER
jgi:alkaline phosphatase